MVGVTLCLDLTIILIVGLWIGLPTARHIFPIPAHEKITHKPMMKIFQKPLTCGGSVSA